MYNNNAQDRLRVQKVCDSFMGTKIELAEIIRNKNLAQKINETEHSIRESQQMLFESKKGVKAYLASLNYTGQAPYTNDISALEVQKWIVVKEKAIYTCLNQMRDRQGTFVGFMWAPNEDQGDITRVVNEF